MTLSLHIKEFASVRLFHIGIKPHFRVFGINLLGKLICIANEGGDSCQGWGENMIVQSLSEWSQLWLASVKFAEPKW